MPFGVGLAGLEAVSKWIRMPRVRFRAWSSLFWPAPPLPRPIVLSMPALPCPARWGHAGPLHLEVGLASMGSVSRIWLLRVRLQAWSALFCPAPPLPRSIAVCIFPLPSPPPGATPTVLKSRISTTGDCIS